MESKTTVKRRGLERKFRLKKSLSVTDYLIFVLGTTLVFLFLFLFNYLILHELAIPFVTGESNPVTSQFNIYNMTNMFLQVALITQIWVGVFFFVSLTLVATIIARVQRLQLGRTFLCFALPAVGVYVGYHLILWVLIREYPALFFEESSFQVLFESIVNSIVDPSDIETLDINYVVFHSYHLLVFKNDPSFENYMYLFLLGKMLVPQYAFFTYDYLIMTPFVIALQLGLVFRFVKPCDCFEDITPEVVETRRFGIGLD